MGRHARSHHVAAWHHVFNRGARRLPIFGDDEDRETFLGLLDDVADRAGIHAFALMGNHYHLLLNAPAPDLSAAMKHIGETYTRRFNRKYGFDGPLFRSRFGSKPIASDAYLLHAVRYIHSNPVVDGLGDWRYPWSSHLAYLGCITAPRWLSTALVSDFGGRDAYRSFVEETEGCVEIAVMDPAHISPGDVEQALGVASREELSVIVAGGRGIRNDVRLALALIGLEATTWPSARLAERYGYRSASSIRTAATRARQRLASDPTFAAMVGRARAVLGLAGDEL